MSKFLINLILLCCIPRLYAPVNIYENNVGLAANDFLKEYAKTMNSFEKSYELWVKIKNSTVTLSRRGEFEKQQFEETDQAWKNLHAADEQWQKLKVRVNALP